MRSSLSRRLDRLEEEGWVARRRPGDADDHRAVVVELTRRGRTLWREMNVTYRRAVQAHVASALDDADVAELRRVLGLLAAPVEPGRDAASRRRARFGGRGRAQQTRPIRRRDRRDSRSSP